MQGNAKRPSATGGEVGVRVRASRKRVASRKRLGSASAGRIPWPTQPRLPAPPRAGTRRSRRWGRAQGDRRLMAMAHRHQVRAQAGGQSGQTSPRSKERAQGNRRPTGNDDLAILAFAKHKDVLLAGDRIDEPTHGQPLRYARLERTETQQSYRGPNRGTGVLRLSGGKSPPSSNLDRTRRASQAGVPLESPAKTRRAPPIAPKDTLSAGEVHGKLGLS